MATLSKKFKKSSKSKSGSRSRKHFNKSRKNGLNTKKMRGGATMPKKQGRMSRVKEWFGMKPKTAPAPAMKPPVMAPTMAQPVTSQIAPLLPVKKPMFWNTPDYNAAVDKKARMDALKTPEQRKKDAQELADYFERERKITPEERQQAYVPSISQYPTAPKYTTEDSKKEAGRYGTP